MPLFGRKRKEEIQEVKDAVELPTLEKIMVKVENPSEKIQEEQREKPSFAPLFVKLDRYRQILNTMNYLKNTMNMIKNTFSILNELEKIRAENLGLIQDTMEKVDKKLLTLDSEFMRPSGFIEDMPEVSDVESLEATLVDLRGQVDQLKTELKSMA